MSELAGTFFRCIRTWDSVAVFTALLVVVAVLQWRTLEKTDATLKSQLAVMQNETRPWITANSTIRGDLSFIEGTGADVPIHVTLLNVGKSPAFNVQYGPWEYIESSLGELDSHCDYLKTNSTDKRDAGIALFPEDRHEDHPFHGIGGGFIRQSDIKTYIDKTKSNPPTVKVNVFVCVDYEFGEPPLHHQTKYLFMLARKSPPENGVSHFTYAFNPTETVPQSELELVPAIDSSVRAN